MKSHFQFGRIFSGESYKGSRGYLRVQKKYEILRTVLYFGLSLSIFVMGYLTTKTRANLLTIVAVLGCLPACKSAVNMIMFLRFRGCSEESAERIAGYTEGLKGLYDMVFTSYDKNYQVAHITVKGNTVCGFTEDASFDEQAFCQHIDHILKLERYQDVTVKIFKEIDKYTSRLEQLKTLDADESHTEGILSALKSVSL